MDASLVPAKLSSRVRRHWRLASLLVALAISPRLRGCLLAVVRLVSRLASWNHQHPRRSPVRKDFLSAIVGAPPRDAAADVSSPSKLARGACLAADALPSAMTHFSDLSAALPDWLAEGLRRGGFERMKPIQRQVLPLALRGCDVVGTAPTGSGKTLAFLVPALVHAAGQQGPRRPADGPLALVLAPTRELALQIFAVAEGLLRPGRDAGLRAAVLYGGARRSDQLQALRLQQRTHLVVATPGRLLDFLRQGAFGLGRVSFFVLDEGDRMLDEGFEPDVAAIAASLRPDRQVLFFSATWPAEVEAAAQRLCSGAQAFERVSAQLCDPGGGPAAAGAAPAGGPAPGRTGIAMPPREIQQVVEVIQTRWSHWSREAAIDRKLPLLLRHLEDALGAKPGASAPGKALVFVSRRLDAEELGATVARRFGLERCGVMHGKRTQEQREAALRAFREGKLRALFTTDVLGRGVDIPDVSHVIVFDFPGDIETYVHRVGRTGRNGRPGTAVAFFEPQPWYPDLARELAEVLRACGQAVPPELAEEETGGRAWGAWQPADWAAAAPAGGGAPAAEAERPAPPLDEDGGPPLAPAAELGEWSAGGARVWGYSANGGVAEQGRLELRAGGRLRTTWGWGEWALVAAAPPAPPAPHCPPPARPCPPAAQVAGEAAAAAAGVPHCPPPTRPCPTAEDAPAEAGGGPRGEESEGGAAPGPRHLLLSWNGVTDVVALDESGLAFELVSRNGRPARCFRSTTLGRALPGATL